MFKHKGKNRTDRHNTGIASLLSFIAGIVNVVGFLAVARLTTNVTGHFAYFVEEVLAWQLWKGFVYFLYILFFFLGSFFSNLIVELVSRKKEHDVYSIPVLIECSILLAVGIFGQPLITHHPDILAYALLFAMGIQNSLVTSISNSVVRTTHLTGLFTDLGIELSQLFFYVQAEQKIKLLTSVQLRLTIIGCFFAGGIVGGIAYSSMGLIVLSAAGCLLLMGLVYDYIILRIILLKRKLHH